MAKNVFRAGTLVELIHAVFKHEGWKFVEGESKSAKLNSEFEISTDHQKGKFVATRRNRPKAAKTIGIREAIEYLAHNDEQELGDPEHGYTVCVTMIAHLLGREPQDVAEMVMAKREADDI